ncbi:c-type cytochrome biogenesis protein CcsB [Corynebacterium sp. sy017]|uniref:c-type cytochrome biogenesis protein CcsB n=1 Tax=unclassified Corynebacterium TaxID=2624378 RepID=UPI00118524EA|nr:MULTISPECIES: c-type cytochrome biogenesis protein CcsB [unclassified Corynebacterium]MBP3089303.1 c-type cytochrome biogenesis protein CcsB [Corynebacterium sp. sy017]QDZ43241.1 c-type cytochrome biogenesis protein CcsB [Corynebacterium sp. sy039]TSD90996.1 c-type cytochrome biogenesis protein CcsB [Corynebacterium sp. SY003]
MNINTTLASLSDSAYVSAFVIYFIGLVLSILYYVRSKALVDMRREQKFLAAKTPVLAGGSAQDTEEKTAVPVASSDAVAKKEKAAEKAAGMTQTIVWLGIIVHAVAVITRGLSASRFPFGNLYEYILVISLFCMVGAALYLQRKELRIMWSWVLVPILALLFFGGTKLYTDSAPLIPQLQSVWFPIHVSTVSTGASIGLISGVASLLYLIRMAQPAGEESNNFFGALAKPLPSAKMLDAIAYRTAIITVPVFGLGIILGAIWAESAWGRPWGWDPKETVAFITWILYAAYLHARATAGWRDSRSAWINILALATMIFNLFFINMVVSGLHSYAGVN